MDQGRLFVLLITSRGTGRWIVPKGWPMADRDAAGAAAQEAWEEAGVIGQCMPHSLGSYFYIKTGDGTGDRACVVEVFPLRVRKLAADYPERHERRRRWFTAEQAAQRVQEPALASLLRHFNPQGRR